MLRRLLRRFAITAALAATCLLAPGGHLDAAGTDGKLTGEIRVKRGGIQVTDRSKVVVFLQGVPATTKDAKGKHTIGQKDLQFDPRVSVVIKGTTVDFPNQDKVFHNVFSASRPARFDLGLYRSGASKSVDFKREGVVDVFCNIHPEMSSRVLVVPSRHYATTDAKGRFTIDGVPAGTYPAIVWHPGGKQVEHTIEIKPGKVATLSAEIEASDIPTEHRRKDGTPYGRYE